MVNSPCPTLSRSRMTWLRSSTFAFAAFAPAPVSSEAVSLPLSTRLKTPTLKKLMNLLLIRNLCANFCGRLRPPRRAKNAIAVQRHEAGELAGTGNLRVVGKREHLHVAPPDAQMI